MVSTTPSIPNSGFNPARIRSIVSSSSLTPSRAKYSPCIGMSTASAATSAFKSADPAQEDSPAPRTESDRAVAPMLRAGETRAPLRPPTQCWRRSDSCGQGSATTARAQSRAAPPQPRHPHQKMVGADTVRIFGETKAAGRIRLRIAVDQQCVHFSGCKRCSQVDGGRGLPDATLLVGNSDYASHSIVRRSRAIGSIIRFAFACNEISCARRRFVCKTSQMFLKEHKRKLKLAKCSCRNGFER